MIESAISNSNCWCRDHWWSSVFHPNRRCYREVPQMTAGFVPGRQICFGGDGAEFSPDLISPVESRGPDGFCSFSIDRAVGHLIVDLAWLWLGAAALLAVHYSEKRK